MSVQEPTLLEIKNFLLIQKDRERGKIYYQKNKAKILQKQKLYQSTRRERYREIGRHWYLRNTKHALDTSKEHYQNNRYKRLQQCKEYYEKNRNIILERIRQQRFRDRQPRSLLDKKRRLGHRQILFSLLGRQCILCGYDKSELALQFDHINGGGRKEWRENWKSHSNMIKYYAHHPDEAKQKLQVLCANCNAIKALTSSH